VYKLTEVTKVYHKDRRTVAAIKTLDLVIADGEWLAGRATFHGFLRREPEQTISGRGQNR